MACRARRPRRQLPADRVRGTNASGDGGFPPARGSQWRPRSAAPAPGSAVSGQPWEAEVAFFRDRTRTFWRRSESLRRAESEQPAATFLPVSARIERADWLETFLPFAPSRGWSELYSAFLVPRVQVVLAFGAAHERPVAAPVAAAG